MSPLEPLSFIVAVIYILLPFVFLLLLWSIKCFVQRIATTLGPKRISPKAFVELLGQEASPIVFSFENINGYHYQTKIREYDIMAISERKVELPEHCKEVKFARS